MAHNKLWGDRRDLNPRQPVPQTGALPTELRSPYYYVLSLKKNGAGDEGRTRDIQLGRLTLYQLSYSRKYKLIMVGAAGFEPAAPCSQGRCATGLRHAPLYFLTRQVAFYHILKIMSTIFLNFFYFVNRNSKCHINFDILNTPFQIFLLNFFHQIIFVDIHLYIFLIVLFLFLLLL